jgi:hypothetical protein
MAFADKLHNPIEVEKKPLSYADEMREEIKGKSPTFELILKIVQCMYKLLCFCFWIKCNGTANLFSLSIESEQ